MRVAIFSLEFPPLLLGGLGIHVYNLTKALSKQGVDIDLFIPKTKTKIKKPWLDTIQIRYSRYFSSKRAVDLNPYIKEDIESISLKNLNSCKASKSRLDRFNVLCAKSVIERHKNDAYDIIHSHHSFALLKACILLKKKTGCPFITTFHSIEQGKKISGETRSKKLRIIESLNTHYPDLIIVVSERVKQKLLENYSPDPRKIRVIHNAIDIHFWNQKMKSINRKKTKRRILFLGRVEANKGWEFFLHAAKKVLEEEKDVLFVMVGGGKDIKKAMNLSKKLGIEKNVIFKDHMPYEKIPTIYASSDVYVFPSVFDAFGITVLEAMVCGVPVIVSKTTGVSDIIKNCIKVDYWNIDEIAKNILRLLRNDELRTSLSKKAKKEVEKFSWNRVAKKTIEVYQELIN